MLSLKQDTYNFEKQLSRWPLGTTHVQSPPEYVYAIQIKYITTHYSAVMDPSPRELKSQMLKGSYSQVSQPSAGAFLMFKSQCLVLSSAYHFDYRSRLGPLGCDLLARPRHLLLYFGSGSATVHFKSSQTLRLVPASELISQPPHKCGWGGRMLRFYHTPSPQHCSSFRGHPTPTTLIRWGEVKFLNATFV